MKAIGPGDQARRVLPSNTTLLGRERRPEGVAALGLADLLALLLKQMANGLVAQVDLRQASEVFGGLAITAVKTRATDPLANASRILLAQSQLPIQRGATAVLVGPIDPPPDRHRTVDRGDMNRLGPFITLPNRRDRLAGRRGKKLRVDREAQGPSQTTAGEIPRPPLAQAPRCRR